MPIMFVLGIIDIFAGVLLAISGFVPFAGVSFIFAIGMLYVLKSLYSIGTAAANGFYLDVLGWADLIAGLFLLLAFFGMYAGIFFFLGIAILIKGLYSFSISILSS